MMGKAFIEVFQSCKADLSVSQLQSLADLDDFAEIEADNLSKTLACFAAMFAGGDKSSLPNDEQIASVLWGLSNQAANISAMIMIVGEANHLITHSKNVDGGLA